MKRIVIAILLGILVFGGVSAQDSVTLFMPFVPNIQFAPVYVAIEKGYFEDAGIEVTLQYGNEPDGVELIAADEIEFGIISGEQVITARANDRPVVYVYEWYQRNPIAVVVPVREGEPAPQTTEELAGLRLGVPGRFGATYSGLTALLSSADLTETDVQLEEIGFNAPEVICVGGVEAAAVYINNEPLQIQQRAAEDDCGDVTDVEVIPVAEFADLASNGLITSEALIAEQPDLLAAMIGAFEQGLIDTLNNPLEAYLISAEFIDGLPLENVDVMQDLSGAQVEFLAGNPDPVDIAERRDFLLAQVRPIFTEDEFLQLRVLLETIALWEGDDDLGVTDADSWTLTQDVLLQMGFIEAPVSLEDAFTNDFVPGSS